jgi:hypothetical protein
MKRSKVLTRETLGGVSCSANIKIHESSGAIFVEGEQAYQQTYEVKVRHAHHGH